MDDGNNNLKLGAEEGTNDMEKNKTDPEPVKNNT